MREDSQLDLRETLLMFYQYLTAVVFDMRLQDFTTDHSGSLVQKYSKYQVVDLAWLRLA